MMLIQTCPALLWGLCVLFAAVSASVSTPENDTDNPTTPWTTAGNENETRAPTWTPSHQSAEVGAATAAVSRMSPTEEAEKNHVATSGSSINTVVLTAVSHSSTEAITTERPAPSSQGATITEGVKQTEGQRQQSTTTVTSVATPAATSAALSPVVFPARPTAVTAPENSSEFSSTTSSNSGPPIVFHSHSTPSVPGASTGAIITSGGSAATFKTTPSSSDVTETHISTERSRVSQPSSATSSPISSSSSAAAAFISTEARSSTADSSTSPTAAILIPRATKKSPNPRTEPPPASTAAPGDNSKSTAATEVQTCSSRSVVKHCLVVIACLALLATIFIVSTIVLCTKLSAKSYRVKRSQEGTEMMCISALLPERNYSYRRQHNPVTNGVLVIPRAGDSDEDGGDNLTLSSFLPDNDRYV